jgi:hypothetical protein
MTQAFYICPRGYVHKSKPSYHYKRKDWDFDYTRPKDTLQFGYGYEIPYYKYAGPKNVDERLFEKEKNHIYRTDCSEEVYLEVFRGSTYRPLYKQKRLKKENGVVYMYMVPKTFSVENRYRQFRL